MRGNDRAKKPFENKPNRLFPPRTTCSGHQRNVLWGDGFAGSPGGSRNRTRGPPAHEDEGQFESADEDMEDAGDQIVKNYTAPDVADGEFPGPVNHFAPSYSARSSLHSFSTMKSDSGKSKADLGNFLFHPQKSAAPSKVLGNRYTTSMETQHPDMLEDHSMSDGMSIVTHKSGSSNSTATTQSSSSSSGGPNASKVPPMSSNISPPLTVFSSIPEEKALSSPSPLAMNTAPNMGGGGMNATNRISNKSQIGTESFSCTATVVSDISSGHYSIRQPGHRLTGPPKSILYSLYGKDPYRKVIGPSDYITWNDDGPPHNLRFTSVFVCPVTGEIFASGRHGSQDKPIYVVRDGFYWYTSKKLAEHGAAARAYDCLSFRSALSGKPYYYIGDDEPYLKEERRHLSDTADIPKRSLKLIKETRQRAPQFDSDEELEHELFK